MNPINLFVRGNPMIMLLITLAGAGVVYYAVRLWRENEASNYLSALVLTGARSIMIGMLGQAAGLVQLLNAVDQVGAVPADLIIDGITNTFIPMVYGTFWFILALALRYIKG